MEEDSSVTATCMFRDTDYVVTMNVEGANMLSVEVEDRLTADQWRGTFDAAYIEDLTHKTGNFKQFSIFVSMLESALIQSSDSVSLDLLTYGDLDSLRQRKTGHGPKQLTTTKTAALNSKRYLILTYTVEFDRIHYPLPLPYHGKPDPRLLQETIRELRAEIKALKGQRSPPRDSPLRDRQFEKLKQELESVLEEKEQLEAELIEYKRNAVRGGTAKEVRILKNVMKNLEEDLMKEKARHQRSANKRSQEYRQLLDEVEELRATERNLRVRVKSLTNELQLFKRSRSSGVPSSQSSATKQERDSRRTRFLRERSNSRERSLSRDRTRNSFTRDRSRSRDRFSSQESRGGRFSSQDGRPPSVRNRTPSPGPSPSAAGTRYPRFDPTAYIKEKERKKKETVLKQKREVRSSLSGSAEKRIKSSPSYLSSSIERRKHFEDRPRRTRTSSVGSVGSQGSLSDIGALSDSSQTRLRNMNRVLKPGRTSSSSAWDSPNVPYKAKTSLKARHVSSTPDSVGGRKKRPSRGKENYRNEGADSDFFDRSAEMSEIDARLNRLQQFMRTNMPR